MLDRQEAITRARTNAPYLAESLQTYPDIETLFRGEAPDHILTTLVAELPEKLGDLDQEMALLRRFKRRMHLLIALADIADIWDWQQVTEHLTSLADICMDRLLTSAARSAGIEGLDGNPVPGFFVLAVGKYGARELNYSSDIDFNIFYDPDVISLPNPGRSERTLIRLSQALIRGFESMTADGYIFRTDLRLRPDPRSNAIAVSTRTAERYYETIGQNWERAAMIKARVCGGDKACGAAFIKDVLSPFIWRRNLDYAAIEDILAIKRQIHASKTGTDIHVPGHHLKLGKGGIREIEFYAQVQQLILGGRVPELRAMRTVDALSALARTDYISEEDAEALTRYYGILRDLEHRAQMIKDEQTHLVPVDLKNRELLSRLAGFEKVTVFETAVLDTLKNVHQRYVALFPDVKTLSSREGNLVFTGVEPDPETLGTLDRLGYQRSVEVWSEMASWLGGRIRATKTERAREYLTSLAPRIIDYCADTGEPDRAFFAFARFFTVVRGGVSLLSMFNQTPERLKQLISMMAQSTLIADRLADHPNIIDVMVDPAFLKVDADSFGDGYAELIRKEADFEDSLNAARRKVREDHFRLATVALTKAVDVEMLPGLFTKIADQTVQALLPVSIVEAERTTGPMKGEIAVLGLGKMGGREMSLTSDLDIMLIYRPAPSEDHAQRLYTKVTQRLINALSAVTHEGGLFEVDMALRPSGRAGPVAVTVDAFKNYYAEKAWTWEFMALTRARFIAASSEDFQNELQDILKKVQTCPRPDLDMQYDIADMLKRVRAEKPPASEWDIKNISGGLRDIEFIAQSFYLEDRQAFQVSQPVSTVAMLREAQNLGRLKVADAVALLDATQFYHSLIQFLSLTCGGQWKDLGPASNETLAELLGFKEGRALQSKRKACQLKVEKILMKRLPF